MLSLGLSGFQAAVVLVAGVDIAAVADFA